MYDNNALSAQILRKASQKAETSEDEYADVHLCMWATVNYSLKTLDTEEHHAGNEAVRS